MERNRVQLAVQSVSLGLLSLALWHFYRTRRRNLREAAIRREWELIWQQDAEGLQEAGLDEYGMRLSDEIEDEITSTQASRPCAKGTKGCGTCNVNYSSLPQGPTRQVCSGNGMTKSIKDVTQTPEHAKIGKVIYASQTGRAKSLAQQLVQHLSSQGIQIELVDPSYYEPEDLAKEKLVLLIAATWSDGSVPLHASFFGRWLEESAADFRVGAQLLDGCKFAVFGIGSKLYGSDYNLVAKSWDHYMEKLGASRILDRGEGDEDEGYVEHRFDVWKDQLVGRIKDSSQSFKQGGIVKKDDDYEDAYDEFFTDEDSEKEDKENLGEALIDVEDVAGKVNPSHNVSKVHIRGGKGQVFKRRSSNEEAINHKQESQIKEMVTPAIRMNLEKQGYKIIGTHSGVKLCRWTKSQLRGRGGCYKHSFYGIESHRHVSYICTSTLAIKCMHYEEAL